MRALTRMAGAAGHPPTAFKSWLSKRYTSYFACDSTSIFLSSLGSRALISFSSSRLTRLSSSSFSHSHSQPYERGLEHLTAFRLLEPRA